MQFIVQISWVNHIDLQLLRDIHQNISALLALVDMSCPRYNF